MTPEAAESLILTYDTRLHRVALLDPAGSHIVPTVLGVIPGQSMHHAASAVAACTAFGANGFQFRYPREHLLDPGERMWVGVEFDILLKEQDYLAEPAFEKLMLRFLKVFVDGAERADLPYVKSTSWRELLASMAVIEARLTSKGEVGLSL